MTWYQLFFSGTIYTIAELDREAQRQHTLFVEVDDQGVPGALQVSETLEIKSLGIKTSRHSEWKKLSCPIETVKYRYFFQQDDVLQLEVGWQLQSTKEKKN